MSESKTNIIKTDLFNAKLAVNQSPVISVNKNQKIISWGKKNSYPDKLIFWFNNDAEHGSICNGKATYVSGKSILSDNPAVNQWLQKANETESFHDVYIKADLDEVISGGYFLKIVSNIAGQPIEFFHIPFAKCRISECLNYVKVCDDWQDNQCTRYIYPVWQKGVVQPSIFYYKKYSPAANKLDGIYSKPEYLQATQDIDTDIRISSFGNSLVSKGFTAGHIVTVFNGEKDPKQQQETAEKIKGNHEGENNAGNTVVIFTDQNGKETQVTAIQTSDLDKQFEVISKRNQQKKLTGHNVSGILFKIKTEGQLGNRKELSEAHELFINEYAKPKQNQKNKILDIFYKARFNQPIGDLKFEQIEIIGVDWSDPNIQKYFTTDEIREKLGFSANPQVASPNGAPTAQPLANNAMVNENIKNLTGRQFQGLMRIVGKYEKGLISKESAIALMTSGFGVTLDEAKTYLNIVEDPEETIKAAIQNRNTKFYELFDKYSHNRNDDEIIYGKIEFGKEEVPQEIQDKILATIKGNPDLTEKDIAKQTGIDIKLVVLGLAALTTAGYISTLNNSITLLEKGINWEIPEGIGAEIYTEYVYGLREDCSPPVLLSTSRDFCIEMYNRTKTKAISFEAINKLENEFGESAWDYRGGFYNNGKETTPWCRHVWKAVTKIKRKK